MGFPTMPANTAKRLSRIRGLNESLGFPPEQTKLAAPPFRAARIRSVPLLRTRVYDWGEFCRIDEVDEDGLDENGGAASKRRWSLKEFLFRSISEGRGRAREKELERERLVQAAARAEKKNKTKKKQPSSNKAEDFNYMKLGRAVSKKLSPAAISKETAAAPPRSGAQNASIVQRRRVVSAHERYYSANRAQAAELKKKTFLPYRQGLLGFFGPVSKLEL